ncbi:MULTISPECIES: GNAT family N-acetyltransferase [unclassified Cryobacterium]|uniref:GNAT family N-acetyltransferase n=1 Tax=unclassified Cryobacterium TaxID=2649013 RepID=UPI002B23A46F|nr:MULTISPECIES: GNAT family N-acetyltransferase [unclassified Cryobacterium]MEA9997579.1 GNAT family N-acetyltransferase [Cryobacterium sp. RTS3]MEB0264256.1 GNAT family N-acetyltransferase [Cryobacterium sp. 10I5]MEB0275219.1 GNAT family N-acetyltransferase [Cryobacterium sp. 5B3]
MTETAAAHYSPEQIRAWARPEARELSTWHTARQVRNSYVATVDGVPAGFSDVDTAGYIDMMFVAPSYLGRGVAWQLIAHVKARARQQQLTELTADVSITARPFFERSGFTVEAEQNRVTAGVQLTNYKMKKRLVSGEVSLSGQLVCLTQDQAGIVRDHLQLHLDLTRAEPGCLAFNVTRTSNPLVWQVEERFEHASAWEAHQERVTGSEWGHATAGIERRYSVIGL